MNLEDKEQLLIEEEETDIENMKKVEVAYKQEMASLLPLRASHQDQIKDIMQQLDNRKGKCDLLHPIIKGMMASYKDVADTLDQEKAFPETKLKERDALHVEQLKELS